MAWHPRDFTIKQRLFALTAIALLPGVIILLFFVFTWHGSREREIHDQALRYGQLASLEMERIISGAEATLKALARAPATRSFDTASCSRYLADMTGELPQFTAIAAIDSSGLLRCRSVMPEGPIRLNERPYFQQVIATGEFVVGAYTELAVTNIATLPLAYPIADDSGTVTGVLVAGLDLAWLGARLKDRQFVQGSALTIADREGVIIAREPFPEDFVGTRIPEAFQHLVRAEEPGSIEVLSQDGTHRVIGYYPATDAGTGLYVSAGLSTDVFLQQVYSSTYRSIGIALAGALAALATAWLIGDRLFQRPIDRLLATVAAWKRGDHSARTGISSGGAELAALGVAIDKYMDDLVADREARQRAEEHRDLIVNELDHRVKNILATVQAVAVQSFTGASSRDSLQAFINRLSAMAAIHEMLMSDAWVSAGLRSVIKTALAPFDEENRQRFSLSGPDLVIRAKAALAISMAMHELCTNAVKYGALREAGGRVSLAWGVTREPDGVDRFELSWVESNGPPVKPPENTGFGSKMIEKALAFELSGTVDLRFAPTGVVCTIRCPAAAILAYEQAAERERKAA